MNAPLGRTNSRSLRFAHVCALTAVVTLAVAGLCPADDSRPAAGPPAESGTRAIASIGITVSDLDRSVAFYRDLLGFEVVSQLEVAGEPFETLTGVFGSRALIARLKLGDETIELTQYLAPRGRPMPSDSRSNDLWFQHVAIIVRDMDEAYARLRSFKVEHASSGPQRLPDWNQAAGGIKAFYFRDPDGHFLEILQFPPGKGNPKWHRDTGRIFLGIDHTAIVVSDTDASLAFYRDLLGMKIVGTSENYGTEQEHLNNVFGARLRITTLRAADGPGVELLEYLTPGGGRPYPVDARPNDVFHWQTQVAVRDVAALSHRLRASHASFISQDISDAQHAGLPGSLLLVRDPDGHALELIQP
jgi:catechol 2,3-dioxygenase-like lactoylglutathione lyase family enzyme